VHFIQQEARRQGKRVYRVDICFKNAFNAMSQAAFWRVIRMFKILDVDLLEQIYEGAMVTVGWPQTMRKVRQSPSTQV